MTALDPSGFEPLLEVRPHHIGKLRVGLTLPRRERGLALVPSVEIEDPDGVSAYQVGLLLF